MTTLSFLNPPVVQPVHPETLTYSGKMPEHHVIVELVWHPAGNEILEQRCIWLTPCEDTISGISDAIDEYLTPIFDDLPTRGVWRVVVAGTMNGDSYETDCGREYDSWVDWDILSANKFPCFGALKDWFKNWKATQ